MNLRRWFSSFFRPRADALSDLRHPTAWLSTWGSGGKTLAGTNVSQQAAMGIAAYYACIRAISEDIGKIPLIVYRRLTPRGKERATNLPLYDLLRYFPNNEMEAMTFRETLTSHALSWGNGYAEIEVDSKGDPHALHPIHPSRVMVRRDEEGKIVYDITGSQMLAGMSQTRMVRLRAENMFHLRGLGSEGLMGYSVLQLARESLGLTLAAQQFGAAFFGNGAHLGGVLEHPGILSDTAVAHLRDSWKKMYVGPEKAGTPAILEEGMKWSTIGIPPNDAQFLETRTFQVREVARWFRMQPHKIQDLADASYANIEHQALEYVSDTLMPWMTRWEQQIQRKLIRDRDYFAEHLILGLLRGDENSRGSFYRTMQGIGTLSPNDIREMENQNPIGPAGDHYFIMANNLAPIEQIVGGTADHKGPGQPGQFENFPEYGDHEKPLPSPPGSRNGHTPHTALIAPVRKYWVTEPDACEYCNEIAEMNSDGLELMDLFDTPMGHKIVGPKAHKNCRCKTIVKQGIPANY